MTFCAFWRICSYVKFGRQFSLSLLSRWPFTTHNYQLRITSLQCLQPKRDAKAELNRHSQACEVLADTGIRVARNGTAHQRSSSLMEESPLAVLELAKMSAD